jgi:DNA polymerase III epsilon subunit-like protein
MKADLIKFIDPSNLKSDFEDRNLIFYTEVFENMFERIDPDPRSRGLIVLSDKKIGWGSIICFKRTLWWEGYVSKEHFFENLHYIIEDSIEHLRDFIERYDLHIGDDYCIKVKPMRLIKKDSFKPLDIYQAPKINPSTKRILLDVNKRPIYRNIIAVPPNSDERDFIIDAFYEGDELDIWKENCKDYLLFFDIETTGLIKRWKAELTDFDNFPDIVEIAWKIFNSNKKLISADSHLIKPYGFIIPDDAIEIHGITNEYANQHGEEIDVVLNKLSLTITKLKPTLVAHNIEYDSKVLSSSFLKRGFNDPLIDAEKVCTMKTSSEYFRTSRYLKLEELHYTLFSLKIIKCHRAVYDLDALVECYFRLSELRTFQYF